jgi:hypothetical protein
MAKLCVRGIEATTPPGWNSSSKFDGRSGHFSTLLTMIRPIGWGIWNVKGSYWKPHSFPGARLTGGGTPRTLQRHGAMFLRKGHGGGPAS